MRTCAVPSIIAVLGLALVLGACDAQPPKPPFAEKVAPPAAAPSDQASAPETLPPAQAANCCACPPAAAACPDVKPAQSAKAPARPAAQSGAAPVRQARTPAPRHAAPRDYAYQAPPAGHGQDYRRYQGPDIATRGGYERRQDHAQGQYQDQYRGEAYRSDRYAYAPPPPQAQGYVERRESYSEHRSVSQHSSGYAHAALTGPCCAGPPVQAAGRDSGGYLTWPGKSAPAPYY